MEEVKPIDEIFAEARQLTSGDRHDDYGDWATEAARVAMGWSAITNQEIKPEHVGKMMRFLKWMRDTHKPKRDNVVDDFGYAILDYEAFGGGEAKAKNADDPVRAAFKAGCAFSQCPAARGRWEDTATGNKECVYCGRVVAVRANP